MIHVVAPQSAACAAVTGFSLRYVSWLSVAQNAGPLPFITLVQPVHLAVL